MSTAFIPLILSAALVVEMPVEPDDDRTNRLRSVWQSGDVSRAYQVGSALFAEIESGPCTVSPKSAQIAFITGMLGSAQNGQAPYGYYLWAAYQIDQHVGGLTPLQREAVTGYRDRAGQSSVEDRLFALTPYFDDHIDDASQCPDQAIEPFATTIESRPTAAFGVFRVRRSRVGAILSAAPVWVYPADEAAYLSDQLLGDRKPRRFGREGYEVFDFTPCTYVIRRNSASDRACRPE